MTQISRLLTVVILSFIFLFPPLISAQNVELEWVRAAKTDLILGQVFEAQLGASEESPDLTINFLINGTEYFGPNGGGACRSDNGLFIGWFEVDPPVARIACTLPFGTPKDASLKLIAYQFRNCDSGERCGEIKSPQVFKIISTGPDPAELSGSPSPSGSPDPSGAPDSSEEIEERIREQKPLLERLAEILFGDNAGSVNEEGGGGGGGGGDGDGGSDEEEPSPEPTEEGEENPPKTGTGGLLTLNTAAATTECILMRAAARVGHEGAQRNVNSQCNSRSKPKVYKDECVPWELLGAIQEKETGIPGASINFNATAAQIIENAKNACSVLVGACPTSKTSPNGGFGGAIGMAQFIPTTWEGYKNSVHGYEEKLGYTPTACTNKPMKQIGTCHAATNCSASTGFKSDPHPCNIMSAFYAKVNKLHKDSRRTVCKTDGWAEVDVRRAAERYFGACVEGSNYYCTDIINKMKDRGYTF